jgi:pimeloyl-ACP methyl ester carboxylesterase
VVGKDPDEDKAQAVVAARRQARGEEVGNNFDARIRAQITGKGAAAGRPQHEPRPDPEFERRFAEALTIDLRTIAFPVMAINGEFDRPNARTHRMAREIADFTNLVLPGKGHLTAMMAGFIPEAYVEGYAAFIARADAKA